MASSTEEQLLQLYHTMAGIQGYAVAQLVEALALRYKPEGRGLIPDGVIGIFH